VAAEAVADPVWGPRDEWSEELGEDSEFEYEVKAPTSPLSPRIP
jgi:hypothetical protein